MPVNELDAPALLREVASDFGVIANLERAVSEWSEGQRQDRQPAIREADEKALFFARLADAVENDRLAFAAYVQAKTSQNMSDWLQAEARLTGTEDRVLALLRGMGQEGGAA